MSIFGSPANAQNATQGSVSSLSTSSSLNTASGDLIVVAVRWTDASSSNVTSITDTAGNTYLPLTKQSASDGNFGFVQLFYKIGATANAANTIKANFSIPVTFSFIYVWDVPITGGTVVFDVQAGGVQNSMTGSISSGAFSTTGNDEIVLVCVAANALGQTMAISQSGYTLDAAQIGGQTYGGSAHGTFSSPQSGTVTMTTLSTMTAEMVIAAFKAAPISTATLTVEKEGLRISASINGDGTNSISTHTGGAGVADKSIEIQGNRMQMHDNGDGTFSVVTTTSTGAGDTTVEWEGLRLKIHPTGTNDPITGEPMYAFVVNPV